MRTKGTGCVMKIKGKDGKLSRYWYILYYANGRQIRESSKFESKQMAEGLLQRRLGETGLGIRPAQDVKAVRYEQIRDALLLEYKNQNRGSLFTAADGTRYLVGVNHLDKFFKGLSVTKITTDRIRLFIEARRKEGAKDPTIRKNLVILRSMLNMARKEGKLRMQDVPHFPMPKDSEPAGQYLEPEMFTKLIGKLPA